MSAAAGKEVYRAVLEEGEYGDCVVVLPPQVLAALGADYGDEILWEVSADGAVTISKAGPDAD